MTTQSKKQLSNELLTLLQEVKIQTETKTSKKVTIRNNAKRTKVFVKIQANSHTQKYLFTFKDGWTHTHLIKKGNWKKPKGYFFSELVLTQTNAKTVEFVENCIEWL